MAEGEGTYNTNPATAKGFYSMDFAIRRTIALVGAFIWSSAASAAVVTLNLDQFPDTNSVPSNAVLTDQYRDIGVLIDARSSVGPPGSLNAISGGTPGAFRFFFFNPDIFGAIAIFSFVEPGTNNPTNATLFRATAGWEVGESVELVTFDEQDNQIASMFIPSPNTSGGFLDGVVEITGLFHKVEIRTSGNPGIGFTNLQFELSEPSFYSINSKTGADELVIIDFLDGSVTVVGSLGVDVGAADLAVLNDRLFVLRDGSNGANPQIPTLMEIAPSTGAVFSSVDLSGVGSENRAEGLATVSGQLVVAFSDASGALSDTLGDLGLDGMITNTTGFSTDFDGLGADSAGNVFSTDQFSPPSSSSTLYAVDVGTPLLTNLNTIASVGLNDLAFFGVRQAFWD